MNKFFQYVVLCLSLFLYLTMPAAAEVEEGVFDLRNIYRLEKPTSLSAAIFELGGEDVSYNQLLKMFVPVEEATKKSRNATNKPSPSMLNLLPDAIPAPYPKPLITLVIDDMGVDRKRSEYLIENLPVPITLSFLPYAHEVQDLVDDAEYEGHEIILHLPWEADRETADPGPHHLKTAMTKEEIEKNLVESLDLFEDYTGVNNHMGSKFSRHASGINLVMAELKKRGLYFLDSKTTADSLAEEIAHKHNIASTHRDVFLDHVEKKSFVLAALKAAEEVARQKGSVVIIGHPKDVTINALEAWLPKIKSRGFDIVSLKEIIKYREMRADLDIASARKIP